MKIKSTNHELPGEAALADAEALADSITIQRIDEASAEPRPAAIDESYIESEYNTLAEEQVPAWDAEGEAASREARVRAAGHRAAAGVAQDRLDGHREVLAQKRSSAIVARAVLCKFRRREPGSKKWYIFRFSVLLLGDVAGIAGAAILRGELIYLAIIQACAAGTSAVTAGVVGADVRIAQRARDRKRDPETLSEDEKQFAHFFQGVNKGEFIVKDVILVALAVTVLVAGGITALRGSVDGVTGGIIFGCLAAAICLASFLNSWAYADEVADHIDANDHDYAKELKHDRKLSNDPDLKAFNEADTEAESIAAEFKSRGAAARLRILALKFRILRQNPGVFGHGPAAKPAQAPHPTLFQIPEQSNGHHDRTGDAA